MSSTNRALLADKFRNDILGYVNLFSGAVSTQKGDWVIKGFIDIAKNIYTISADTKVVSKIMELLLFPQIRQFAEEKHYKMILCKEQNFYPDVSFIDGDGNRFALDLKSTYRNNATKVNGMTLGAFTGYFRKRQSSKNITFPYEDYIAHFVLGLVYSRTDDLPDEQKVHKLNELQSITSVIGDFKFFIHQKYMIATDRPGSGNTKNIGSVTNLDVLLNGKGPFSKLGEKVFDDYWTYYLTRDMARAADLPKPPYRNLREYLKYRKIES